MKVNRRIFLKYSSLAAVTPAIYMPLNETEFRVAIIGHTGRGNYGHGMDTLWKETPGCSIVAVADPVADGLNKAQQRLGVEKGYSDYRQMLKETKPDIVSIAPRHIDQHFDMIMAAMESGVKGLYVEKPFCRDLSEARQIVEICRHKGVKLALAHRNRYHPALRAAQNLIAEGRIGRVMEVRGRGKEDHRGGALDLWVLGSHVLNLVPQFTGRFTSCSAIMLQDKRPVGRADLSAGDEGVGLVGGNRLHARFDTESGIPFYFDSIRNAGVKEGNFGFQVLGNQGVIDVRIDTEPFIHYLPVNPFYPAQSATAWQPVSSGGVGVPEPVKSIVSDIAGHQAAARDLMEAIRENRLTLCNEMEGYATIEAIMAVFESHRRGGEQVKMPLEVWDNPLSRL